MKFLPRAGIWLHEGAEGSCRRCAAAGWLWVRESPEAEPEGPWCALACWGRYHDEQARFIPAAPPGPAFAEEAPAWNRLRAPWNVPRAPGTHPLGRDRRGEVLGFYDEAGELRGLLWHRPDGRLGVLVDPEHRRKGVGRALVCAAARRWPILLDEPVSPEGAALRHAALPRSR